MGVKHAAALTCVLLMIMILSVCIVVIHSKAEPQEARIARLVDMINAKREAQEAQTGKVAEVHKTTFFTLFSEKADASNDDSDADDADAPNSKDTSSDEDGILAEDLPIPKSSLHYDTKKGEFSNKPNTSSTNSSPSSSSDSDSSSSSSSSSSSGSSSDSSSDSSSSSSSDSSSSEFNKPDNIVLDNNALAKQIEERLSLKVLILRIGNEYQSSMALAPIKDEAIINRQLNMLSRTLSISVKNLCKELSITSAVIAGGIDGDAPIVIENNTLLIPCGGGEIHSSEINHFLFDTIIAALGSDISLLQSIDFAELNPNDFTYGKANESLLISNAGSGKAFFFSAKAQASVSDDIYESFKALMLKRSQITVLRRGEPLYNKAKLIYDTMSSCLPSLKNDSQYAELFR